MPPGCIVDRRIALCDTADYSCVLEMWWFTCACGLIGVHVAIDTPPPGLIITRLLRLAPSVHCSQQTQRGEKRRDASFHHADAELLSELWISGIFSWCMRNMMRRTRPTPPSCSLRSQGGGVMWSILPKNPGWQTMTVNYIMLVRPTTCAPTLHHIIPLN